MPDELVTRLAAAPTLDAVTPVIDIVDVTPPNPPKALQEKFVGLSYDAAFEEARRFVGKVAELAAKSSVPLDASDRILDFGSGWGRISRFLLTKTKPTSIYAVDVDPEMTALVNSTLPGLNAVTSNPLPPTPFGAASFDGVLAFSVFSHLAGHAHEAWAQEFGKLVRPGGFAAITVLERQFLDVIKAAQAAMEQGDPNDFQRSMSTLYPDLDGALAGFAQGEIQYAATGGGEVRTSDFYGWAAAPRPYVERVWGDAGFDVSAWIPTDELFPQALVFLTRRNSSVQAEVNRRARRGVGEVRRLVRGAVRRVRPVVGRAVRTVRATVSGDSARSTARTASPP